MAITKLYRMKEAKGADKSQHLRRNIFYICNPDKTEDGRNIGSNAGRSPAMIYQTMMQNKEYWNKTDMTQGFHYVISFPPDCGVSETVAARIATRFCQELFGDDYYYVFAIHNDKEHLHAHITFDSVSKTDGHKFHSPKGDWQKRIQPITDKLCEQYHLPTLSYDPEGDRKGSNYGDWKIQKEDEKRNHAIPHNWMDIIRDDLDDAITHCTTMAELISYLRKDQYEVRVGKYVSLKPPGRERAIRTGRLGSGYSKEDLIQRLERKIPGQTISTDRIYGEPEKMYALLKIKVKGNPGYHMNPFMRQYYRRWNATCFIRKPGAQKRWCYKSDLLELEKLSDCIIYLMDHEIGSTEELNMRIAQLDGMRKSAIKELTHLYYLRKKDTKAPSMDQVMEQKKLENDIKEHKESLALLRREANVLQNLLFFQNTMKPEITLPHEEKQKIQEREEVKRSGRRKR